MAGSKQNLDFMSKLYVGILLTIFGGIVLHAPLIVGFGTLFPSAELLIKSWKEILLLLATVLGLVILARRHRWDDLKHPLVLLIAGYAALHLALVPMLPGEVVSVVAGLMIDLRYLLFFVLVFIAITLYPGLRRPFLITFGAGALIVATFALLQVTVLPVDVLKYIGYGPSTIMPYLTVDQNMDFIRINSTLRGPNPLGAFAGIVLSLLAAFWLRGHHGQFKRPMFVVSLLVVGSLVALWASYSRSALVAAVVAIGIVFALTIGKRFSKWVWIGLATAALVIGGGLYLAGETPIISTVILHEDPAEGGDVNSNEGHIESLAEGTERMVRQPLGAGIGSTGSASFFGDSPLVIENQYLFIAHEVGWLGLALFLVIFWKVLRALWARRADWLALGVFASGIGMALIGLLLPVWVDDTVAIIWWGLAAIAIGGVYGRTIHKTTKRTA